MVSGESEEVEAERCSEVPLLEETGYGNGNHHGVTVAPLTQEEIISGPVPHIQNNSLYAWILVVLKTTQNWVVNSTPYSFGTFLQNSKDKGKVCLRECLPRKARGSDTRKKLKSKEQHVLFFLHNVLIGSTTNAGSIHG